MPLQTPHVQPVDRTILSKNVPGTSADAVLAATTSSTRLVEMANIARKAGSGRDLGETIFD